LAITQLGGNITAYTISVPGDPWDEALEASATAQRLGISHQVLELTPEEPPEIGEMITAYGEPFACASALGMLRVSQAVSSEATVLLTGDGVMTFSWAIRNIGNLWLAEKVASRLPPVAARVWLAGREWLPRRGLWKRAASFLDYAAGGLGAVACAHDGLPTYEQYGILGARLVGEQVAQRDIPWSQESARHVLSEFLEHDRRTRFVGEYMTKVDGATMHYALEARSPFLDQQLWEFASSLPTDLRLHGGRLKSVLRELASRKVDQQVARGRKRGFSIPVQRWLAGRWRRAFEELLRDSILESEGWIRSEPALDWLQRSARAGWAPNQLWYLFVLESWLRSEHNLGRT